MSKTFAMPQAQEASQEQQQRRSRHNPFAVEIPLSKIVCRRCDMDNVFERDYIRNIICKVCQLHLRECEECQYYLPLDKFRPDAVDEDGDSFPDTLCIRCLNE